MSKRAAQKRLWGRVLGKCADNYHLRFEMLGAKTRLRSAFRKGFVGFLKRVGQEGHGTLWSWVRRGVSGREREQCEQAGDSVLANGQSSGLLVHAMYMYGRCSGLSEKSKWGHVTGDLRC